MTIRLLLLILFMSLSGVSFCDNQVDYGQLQGIGDTRYHLFDSERLGHPLHVFVRLPRVTSDSADKKFPVVYLLDGGVTFPLLSAYYHYLRNGEEVPEMILVGISYGSDTFEGGNYRSSDFTAPAEDREWWGKAGEFQGVLKDELLPMIESSYPADVDQRIIFGHSQGGQFVLFTALTDADLFHGLIASNPALHRNLPFFLEWQGPQPVPQTSSRMYVSLAENDDERFQKPAYEWVDHWKAEPSKPWALKIQVQEDQTHLSSVPVAFRQGILWLFSTQE